VKNCYRQGDNNGRWGRIPWGRSVRESTGVEGHMRGGTGVEDPVMLLRQSQRHFVE
jgi:hypothetical protein